MHPKLRNILAVAVAIFAAFGVISLGHMVMSYLIPPPEGFDPSTPESFKATAHLLRTKDFLGATAAHAGGAFVGGLVVALLTATNKMRLVWGLSVVLLAAGIMNAFSIPAPTWVHAFDLIVAYIPFCYFGGILGGAKNQA